MMCVCWTIRDQLYIREFTRISESKSKWHVRQTYQTPNTVIIKQNLALILMNSFYFLCSALSKQDMPVQKSWYVQQRLQGGGEQRLKSINKNVCKGLKTVLISLPLTHYQEKMRKDETKTYFIHLLFFGHYKYFF